MTLDTDDRRQLMNTGTIAIDDHRDEEASRNEERFDQQQLNTEYIWIDLYTENTFKTSPEYSITYFTYTILYFIYLYTRSLSILSYLIRYTVYIEYTLFVYRFFILIEFLNIILIISFC